MKVVCDIHRWESAYWLVLEHPYAAITNADGTFTIRDLPVGEHNLIVWHEAAGYVDKEFSVTVKSGNTTLETVEVPASKFVP